MKKSIFAGLAVIVLGGCTNFPFCQKLVEAVESTKSRSVYDHVDAKVEYSQDLGGSVWTCSVSVSVSGYIGQTTDLQTRPDYIPGVLK